MAVFNGGNGTDFVTVGNGATNNDDQINTRGGNDFVESGGGNDTISAGDGRDNVDGGSGNDAMNGGNGNDVLGGGTGRDNISAGNGADDVSGGRGNDTMDAGSDDANDQFYFSSTDTSATSQDVITNFDANSEDTIVLQNVFVDTFYDVNLSRGNPNVLETLIVLTNGAEIVLVDNTNFAANDIEYGSFA